MKRLNGMDALLLYSETPNVHTHTLKIAIVAPDVAVGFDIQTVRGIFAERLRLLEPLRYVLVDIPWRLHHPMWLQDCAVDLAYHVRRVRVPAPGGRRELDRVIGEIAGTPLDRSRPLWEFYVAEGLQDGRCALIGKIHHALADGVASANLLARLMDTDTRTGCEDTGTGANHGCDPPSTWELLRAAGRDHAAQLMELPAVASSAVAGYRRVRSRVRARGEHPGFARPMHAPPSFLNHVLSPVRTFASESIPLADVKSTARRLGVTINDLVLAVCAGALRELALSYDGVAEQPLLASVPVSTDRSSDRISGNEIGGLMVSLPIHVADPLERVGLVARASQIAKENQELFGQELYGRLMTYLPAIIATPALKWAAQHDTDRRLMNVPVSNVAGRRSYGHLRGARVSEMYSVGPLAPGCGINITVWSYVAQLNVSVLADDRTVTDPHEATDAITRSFDEIRAASGP